MGASPAVQFDERIFGGQRMRVTPSSEGAIIDGGSMNTPASIPSNGTSVNGQDVAVVFRPGAPELTDEERTTIAAATGRVRFFVCGWSDIPFSKGADDFYGYPKKSIDWAIDQCTLVEPRTLGVSPSSDPGEFVEQLLAMDAKADNDDYRVSLTLVVLEPFDPDKMFALHIYPRPQGVDAL